MSGERTEKATPRRRQQAAEKGDRVQSRELVSASAMLAGVIALGRLTSHWADTWVAVYQMFLDLGMPQRWKEDHLVETLFAIRHCMVLLLIPVLLLFTSSAGAALFIGIAQGRGLHLNAEMLKPKWERINIGSNFKNLFSLRVFTRLGKSMIPTAFLLVLAIQNIKGQSLIPPMSVEMLPSTFGIVYGILLDTSFLLFAWSAIDYLMEWRSWENRLKMSHQELREEFKQTEGNPQVRGRIRSLRRQMRRRRMKADVSRASAVITNPTHYAVALSFDFESMEPPRVLTKGRDLLAAQIKSDARWAGVPIVENPPLARSLYRHVEEGHAIPFELYSAVAAILGYLYRQQVEERLRKESKHQKVTKPSTSASSVSPQIILPTSSTPHVSSSAFMPKEKP